MLAFCFTHFSPTRRIAIIRIIGLRRQEWCAPPIAPYAPRPLPHIRLALDLDPHARIDQPLHLDRRGGGKIVAEIRDAARVDLRPLRGNYFLRFFLPDFLPDRL